MDSWWYAVEGKQVGPITRDEIQRLLQKGEVDRHTLTWREGMDNWVSLEELDEFKTLEKSTPPPIPSLPKLDPLAIPEAGRWTRFFARLFDLWIGVIFIACPAIFAFAYFAPDLYLSGFADESFEILLGMLSIFIAICADSIIYGIFKNTPGKALLRVRVTALKGEPLNFSQYFSRNMSVWATGLGLGIPLVNIATMLRQFFRIGSGKLASYDEADRFRVRCQPVGWGRRTLFILVFIILFLVMAILNGI